MEVCPFSRKIMLLTLNLYSCHYSMTFAFSTFSYLHHQQHSLQSTCLVRQWYRLTMFHLIYTVGLGCAFSPVALCPCIPTIQKDVQLRPILGRSLSASLAPFEVTTFISTSHMLTIPTSLATHPH